MTHLRATGDLAEALYSYPDAVREKILDRDKALASSDVILDALILRVLPRLLRVALAAELDGAAADLAHLRLDCLTEQRRRTARAAGPEAVAAGQVRA